jgi:hypothetical protein
MVANRLPAANGDDGLGIELVDLETECPQTRRRVEGFRRRSD